MTLTSVQSIFAGNESSREYWFTIHLGPMPKGCLPVNKYKYKLHIKNNFFKGRDQGIISDYVLIGDPSFGTFKTQNVTFR